MFMACHLVWRLNVDEALEQLRLQRKKVLISSNFQLCLLIVKIENDHLVLSVYTPNVSLCEFVQKEGLTYVDCLEMRYIIY